MFLRTNEVACGDHLYYFCAGGIYSHHGIDVGDGRVIHYESTPWLKLVGGVGPGPPPQIVVTSRDEFSRGNDVHTRHYGPEDGINEESSRDEVLSRAFSRLGEADYTLYGNNCEHFAVWCKTGRSASSQVDAHRMAAVRVVRGAPLGMMLIRTARRLPGPYRQLAILGATAAAGAIYAGEYLKSRKQHRRGGLS